MVISRVLRPTPMSANTRQGFINYIVNRHLGLTSTVWWAPKSDPHPETIAYREWASDREPELRAALETMSDDALLTAYDECNARPGWLDFSLHRNELQEQREETERQRQYHRSVSKKGGHAHQSRGQAEIVAACRDMYRHNPKITSTRAHQRLSNKGHVMPDGRRVVFTPKISLRSFQARYWPLRRT
jgi:hypothetical protein